MRKKDGSKTKIPAERSRMTSIQNSTMEEAIDSMRKVEQKYRWTKNGVWYLWGHVCGVRGMSATHPLWCLCVGHVRGVCGHAVKWSHWLIFMCTFFASTFVVATMGMSSAKRKSSKRSISSSARSIPPCGFADLHCKIQINWARNILSMQNFPERFPIYCVEGFR